MKFDLQKALTGAVVKTRDGALVTHFVHYPEAPDPFDKVVAFVEGVGVETFNEQGQYFEDDLSSLDLVIVSKAN